MVPGVCIFLAVITLAVFGQTFHYDFVNVDDDIYVYENAEVRGGLTLNGIAAMFTHVECNFYHPFTMISLMANYQLHGLQPGGYHVTNVLLHILSAILLFLILREMTGFLWRSAFVAALFAIHPLRVESVAWIAERKDVLGGVGFMLTLWAYIRYVRAARSTFRYLVVVVFFALGLMCKPSFVTLPFVLLLLDYWPLHRFGGGTAADGKFASQDGRLSVFAHLIMEKVPLFMLSAAASVMAVIAEGEAINPLAGMSFLVRMSNSIISYATYLRQMVYPADLAPFYPFLVKDLLEWKIILALTLLVTISAVAVAAWRKRPYLLVGWLWYLGMLVPMIGIIQLGGFAHADRFTYLPMIGLFVALTWTAADLCAGFRHRRLILGSFSTLILVALILCARTQTSYWRNNESLWTHTLACTSDNYFAHNNLGFALLQKGNVNEAIRQCQEAVQINPNDAMAHLNLGDALLQKGKVDEAIAHYLKALEISPTLAKACYDLGIAFSQKGNMNEAIIYCQKALAINPDYTEAHVNLGVALFQKGDVDEAIVHYQKALQINPDYAEAHINFGIALLQKGDVDEAIVHYQKALQINPDYAEAHVDLGNALFKKGNVDEAMAHYQMALKINPNIAEAHSNLGNALLQKGDVDGAIAHYQRALQIKPDYLQVENVLAWVLATTPQASLRNGNQAVKLAQQANQLAGGENPSILCTLAAAYAEVGRFNDAVRSSQKAVELEQAAGRTDLAEQINGELKLYEAGVPFHQENN
jgi:tetratricopeptide (TPR) repeat protein